MISEIYDALLSTGADKAKARKAAEEIAEHEKRSSIKSAPFDLITFDQDKLNAMV